MDNALKKRCGGEESDKKSRPRNDAVDNDDNDEYNELLFEDPFGDDFEEDEEVIDENDDLDEEDEKSNEDENMTNENLNEEDSNMNIDDDAYNNPDGVKRTTNKQVWRPGVDQIPEGEELEYDPSAYVMYHSLNTEWPCLSFDIVKDNLGEGRRRFPLTMYAVCGSQADRTDKNKLTILRLSDLHKTQIKIESDSEDDSDDDEESEDENLDDDPTVEHINVNHVGAINRLRVMPQSSGIVASMSDQKTVQIFDLSTCIKSMMSKGPRATPPTAPTFTFRGHVEEGFALDWSPVTHGTLATGDCAGNIHIWDMLQSKSTNNSSSSSSVGKWHVDPKPYKSHKNSIEDIQWSPTEGTVFCSASADKSVKIWDIRGRNGPQITLDDIHTEDVNVISWNRMVSYLLVSGSDDGSFKVWDLRAVRSGHTPLAHFNYHQGPITSVEWSPSDESMLAVSSADNQVTIWDLSVEEDEEPAASAANASTIDFPAQLLFIHQGQQNVKELHFHPQIPGLLMTTAEDGLNVFQPAITVSSSTDNTSQKPPVRRNRKKKRNSNSNSNYKNWKWKYNMLINGASSEVQIF